MAERPPPRPARLRRLSLLIASVLIGVVLGYAGIRALANRTAGDPTCRPAVALARQIAPLAQGEVAALAMATTPLRVPDLAFEDADGKTKKLSEWRGRTVLVNLWATWCVPCRREMPALDQLHERGAQHVGRAAAHQVLGVHARRVRELVPRAGSQRVDRGAGVEIIQRGAGQVLAVVGVHGCGHSGSGRPTCDPSGARRAGLRGRRSLRSGG